MQNETVATGRTRRRVRRVLVFVAILITLYLSWARILAELLYIGISAGRDDPNADIVTQFYLLEDLAPSSTPVLLRLLRAEGSILPYLAAESLAKTKDPRAVPELMRIVAEDEDSTVRDTAIRALASIGDARAVPVLKEAAPDSGTARKALGRLGKSGRAALLQLADGNPDPEVRGAAIWELCSLEAGDRDKRVAELAISALDSPARSARSRAAGCVRLLFGPEARPLLLPRLEDADLRVRLRAVQELGRLGDPSGFGAALEILEDESVALQVRSDAARALGETGDPRAEGILRELAQHASSQKLRWGAEAGLRKWSEAARRRTTVPDIEK